MLISAPGCSLSAGRAVSLLALCALGVSPVPLIPQESRTLLSNQLVKEAYSTKNVQKQQSFKKMSLMEKVK
jgi:hypothetical protein